MYNIFLFSNSTDPKSIKVLEENIPDLYTKNIAYIETGNSGYGYDVGFTPHSQEFVESKFANFEIIDIDSNEFASGSLTKVISLQEKLLKFDILLLSGGLPGYLKYWLDRYDFGPLLKKFLSQNGIYIGSSASSMVMASSFKCAQVELDDEMEIGASNFQGFGFVEGEIWPHYQDEHEDTLAKFEKENDLKITRLRDGEGIYLTY
ncbi:Type 1 glutamine amidotransferase-like domain-containing protein [bacterium]|nr:MAG: Type 1 glutamine amidotransferase-like domain-containing protein [bacterium]